MISGLLRLESCVVDLDRRTVTREGTSVRLSSREAEVLEYMAERPGVTVTKEELERAVWEMAPGVVSEAVNVAMRRLRSRIEAQPKRPAHLHTVRGVGWSFHPLRPSAAPHQLPRENLRRPADRYVGRADELAQVAASLADGARVVAIQGPPGVGKSRLALECAHVHLRGIPNAEAWWLAPLAQASPSPEDTLAAAMGLPRERLWSGLSARRDVLVVIDDAGALGPEGPAFLERLLQVPLLTVLLVDPVSPPEGGVRLLLRPLSQTEARELFGLRAGAQALQPYDEGTIAQLVDALDGHPLAVELAAPMLETYGAQTLLAEIEAGHTEGRIRDAIAASWGALSPPDRAGLEACSVFDGGFTLKDAAPLISEAGLPAMTLVGTLRDRWLLRVEHTQEATRYEVAPAVRRFVDRQGDARDARVRHAALFSRFASADRAALHGPSGVVHLRHLQAERANLEAALAHSTGDDALQIGLALFAVATIVGDGGWRQRLAEALVLDGCSDALCAEARVARASVCIDGQRLDDAEAELDALPTSTLPEASGLVERVRLLYARGEPEAARRLGEEAIEASEDPAHEVDLRLCLAFILGRTSNGEEAAEWVFGAEAICSVIEDDVRLARALFVRGELLKRLGREEESKTLITRALPLFVALGARKHQALCRRSLAVLERGLPEQQLREVAVELRALGLKLQAAITLAYLAEALAATGDLDGADVAGMQSQLLADRERDAMLRNVILCNAGLRSWMRGRRARAERAIRASKERAEALGGRALAKLIGYHLAGLLADVGDPEAAREHAPAPRAGDVIEEAQWALALAWISLAEGEPGPAVALLGPIGEPEEVWRRWDMRLALRILAAGVASHA